MTGQCRLCHNEAELCESHVLPKFAWDWLKRTAVSGIRVGNNPNRRVQDGMKDFLLCLGCEGRFAVFEKAFSENIFVPVHRHEPIFDRSYGPWALEFAVSVSWRVLQYHIERSPLVHFSLKQRQAAQAAGERWRQFLLRDAPHPGNFEQHLIPLDLIDSHSARDISPFINRYITRTLDMDVVCSERAAMTFAKVGQIVIFGLISFSKRSEWKGTKLRLRRGDFSDRYLRLPGGIYEYLNQQADRAKAALDSLSPRQAAKAEQVIWRSPEKVANSLAFEAMARDIGFSGNLAFASDDDYPP